MKILWHEGLPFRYREDSSALNTFTEIVVNRSYRRTRLGFDVEKGERWLDLGANVGSFAIYCKLRKASVVSYEPDKDCFELLKKNAPFAECVNKAVTGNKAKTIDFFPAATNNYSRGSIIKVKVLGEAVTVANDYIGDISGSYDGIKMDIEGSEFGILDSKVLPKCKKLVLEYHTSRDSSGEHLKRRIAFLKSRFKTVQYPAELDRLIASGEGKTYFDSLIFCMGTK